MLDRVPDREVILPAAGFLGVVLLAVAVSTWGGVIGWPALLTTWLALGIGYSAAQTPTGRLLRRSATAGDLSGIVCAVARGLAADVPSDGWLGAEVGTPATLGVLKTVIIMGVLSAALLWPAADPDVLEHDHDDLAQDDAHLRDARGHRYAHAFLIDDLHQQWPANQPDS